MTTKDEALKEALDALLEYKRLYEEVQPAGGWQGVYEMGNEAIQDCRAALAEQDSEPVGFALPTGMKVRDISFSWNGETQEHTPNVTVSFEPVPANSPFDAKGWVDRDNFVSFLTNPQPAPAVQPEPVTNDEQAAAFIEAKLWEAIDMNACFPSAKVDPRIWGHVFVYAPQPAPAVQPLTEQRIKQLWVQYAPEIGAPLIFARAIEQAHGITPEAVK